MMVLMMSGMVLVVAVTAEDAAIADGSPVIAGHVVLLMNILKSISDDSIG